jgi:hypothetical protein
MRDLGAKVRPKPANALGAIEDDLVASGCPNWRGIAPGPIRGFSEECGFSDEIIAPFCRRG